MCFLIHFQTRFALTPCPSASFDTDAPGSRQAAIRRSFDAGSNRRRPFRPTSRTTSFLTFFHHEVSTSFRWTPHAKAHSITEGVGKFALTLVRDVSDQPSLVQGKSAL